MIADNIANHLVSNTNLKKGKTLFIDNAPDTPSDCVIVYGTGGPEPYQELPVDKETVQILCRGRQNGYTATKARAEEIYNLLNRKVEITIDGLSVMQSKAIQIPTSIGLNDRNQWEIVCNYLLEIRK